MTIVASPGFAQDHTVYAGTSVAATRRTKGRVVLWRSRNKGRTWHQVTTQETDSRWMDISMPADVTDKVADQAVVVTGPFCLRPLRKAKDVWISTAVDPSGANVLSVVAIGDVDDGGVLVAATGNGCIDRPMADVPGRPFRRVSRARALCRWRFWPTVAPIRSMP